MPATQIQSTTQDFIDIYDITNDITIMKDGSCSLIITVDALNFGLLAEEEQDAIMYSYAGLLNSLNYPIQIVIRSQTKDATNYLNLLREQELRASSELKKNQIRAYAGFVADLIRERNVLDKKFYIIIPASPLEMGLLPPSTVVPGVKQIDVSSIERSVILDKAKNILEPKRDHLVSQFGRIGLPARQLTTQEIIQLFYTSYNPEAAEGQQITNSNDYTTPLVTGQAAMPDLTPAAPVYQPESQPDSAPSYETQAPAIAPTDATTSPGLPVEVPNSEMPSADTNYQVADAQSYEMPAETPQPELAQEFAPPITPMAPPMNQTAPTQLFDASAQAGTMPANPTPAPEASLDSTAELQEMINISAQQAGGLPPNSTSAQTTIAPPMSKPLTPSTPSVDDLPPLPEI